MPEPGKLLKARLLGKEIEEYKASFLPNKSAEIFGERATFSMVAYDFERLHEINKKLDDISYLALSFDLSVLRNYWSVLNLFYLNLKPLIYRSWVGKNIKEIEDKLKELDEKTKEFLKDLMILKKYNKDATTGYDRAYKILEELQDLHSKLLIIKQELGLGIKTEEIIDVEQRLDNIL